MMLYENTKVKFCSADGDTYFFDITAKGYISHIPVHNLLR